jgi:AhpD family alkylhydroperoxidase
MTDYAEVLKELSAPIDELRKLIPDAWSGYVQTGRGAMGDGALSAKHKELIALAISVVKKCDGCLAAHARGAARRGATPAEVAETIGVTLLLEGGPATVWGPRAWEAYHQFLAEGPKQSTPESGA